MQEFKITSFDGYELNCLLWDDVENPKGVFQITHGMAEHASRYDRFARFMNENGYFVFGNDLRAHGKSAGDPKKVSLVVNGDLFEETLNDQIFLSEYLAKKYPELPLFYMGHSYGSFLSQKYIQKCHLPKAVILMGSAKQPAAMVVGGKLIADLTCAFKGKDAPAKMIAGITFGSYSKQFTTGAWITADEEIATKYFNDPYCNVTFSAGFYKYFFKGLKSLYKKEGLSNIPKDLPLFIVSGENDPVGGPKKLVEDLFAMYRDLGLTNVSMKLYPNMRHEILNELDYMTPFTDILNFVNENNK